MKTRTWLLALAVVCLALTGGGAFFQEEITDLLFARTDPASASRPRARKPKKVHDSSLDLDSPYKNEMHWIHTSICEDIAEMVSFAGGPSGTAVWPRVIVERQPDLQRWVVRTDPGVAGAGRDWEQQLEGFMWSPETYEPWVRALLSRRTDTTASSRGSLKEDVMGALTDARAGTIEAQNQIVSRWLQIHPLDANAHDAAALILAAFALRERSGSFTDQRWALNRITAHLTMARAIRQGNGGGPCGEMAEIALSVLVGRQADATARIDSWRRRDRVTTSELAWLNALGLHNWSDWRAFERSSHGRLIERIEHFQSMAFFISSRYAMKHVDIEGARDIPDWSRILGATGGGVAVGHFSTAEDLRTTMKEIGEVFRAREGEKPTDDLLPDFLNRAPGTALRHEGTAELRFEVIDDGGWGRFGQRHLCSLAHRTESFMRDMWAVDDAAEDFRNQMDPLLRRLIYFPILQKLRSQNQEEYQDGMNGSAKIVRAHPEWISDYNWILLRDTTKFKFVHVIPYYEHWFEPVFLPGTAYSSQFRVAFPSIWKGPASQLEPLLDLCPMNPWFVQRYVEIRFEEKPTAAQYKKYLQPFMAYSISSMYAVARSTEDTEEYVEIMGKICSYAPDSYFALGAHLATLHRDEEAAAAYEKGVKLAEDRVNAANLSEWLINYYFEHGRQEDAMALAQQAAGVGSHYGYEALMKLYERMGRIAEAETVAMQIERRYDAPGARAAIYLRQLAKDSDSPYRSKFAEVVKRSFPNGLEKVTLASFDTPPSDGVMTYNESGTTKEIGLQERAVIVALDGVRVHNEDQYHFVRDLSYSEEMTLIVWQAGAYKELKFESWRRLLHVQLIDYRAP